MPKEIKMKDKDGYVYPLPKIIYVGSQVIYNGKSGSGSVVKTNLIDCYSYNLIDSIFTGISTPPGYHREYKLTVVGTTQGAGELIIHLNNIEIPSIHSYSAATFKESKGTSRFKESDIELVYPFNHQQMKGLILSYEVRGSNNSWSFENVTVHGYLVAD